MKQLHEMTDEELIDTVIMSVPGYPYPDNRTIAEIDRDKEAKHELKTRINALRLIIEHYELAIKDFVTWIQEMFENPTDLASEIMDAMLRLGLVDHQALSRQLENDKFKELKGLSREDRDSIYKYAMQRSEEIKNGRDEE